MPNKWDGTHPFLFQPWNLCGGDPNAIVSMLKNLGVTGVLIKFADGSLANDPNSQHFMDQFKILAPLFKAAGIRVGGWIYQYLTDVQGEVDACAQAIEAGADWIVLDAEIDVYGKNAQVQQFGQLLRAKYPSVVVGLSSFAIASYHPQVPFTEYAAFVDVMLPQVYWATMQWDVEVVFNASIASYQKYGKPIAPTGQAYSEENVNCKPDDMARFVQLCKDHGMNGISWWDLQHATQEQLNAISGNLVIAPESVPEPTPVDPPVAEDPQPDPDALDKDAAQRVDNVLHEWWHTAAPADQAVIAFAAKSVREKAGIPDPQQ